MAVRLPNPIIQYPVWAPLSLRWDRSDFQIEVKELGDEFLGITPKPACPWESLPSRSAVSAWAMVTETSSSSPFPPLGNEPKIQPKALWFSSLLMLSTSQIILEAKQHYILHWTFVSKRKFNSEAKARPLLHGNVGQNLGCLLWVV